MSYPIIRCIALAGISCLFAACSKSASITTAETAVTADPATHAATPAAGNVCDRKLLVAADVAGILVEPITGTKPLDGDPQTCYFITATEAQGGPSIMVTLRPSNGGATIQSWLSGAMGSNATPVNGVGDSAVWVSALNELDAAAKNDQLCVISKSGAAVIQPSGYLRKKFGDLCNKIFAAN
jgi:hypothetical protein